MTPAGIEPATFQFVAQHLNHCATVTPKMYNIKFHHLSDHLYQPHTSPKIPCIPYVLCLLFHAGVSILHYFLHQQQIYDGKTAYLSFSYHRKCSTSRWRAVHPLLSCKFGSAPCASNNLANLTL